MKNILRGLLFVSFFKISILGAMASDFPEVIISNFEGSYQGVSGEAFAERFSIAEEFDWRQVSFQVFKESTQMRFQGPEGEFVWEDVPTFLLELQKITWSGAQANSGASPNKVSLSLASFQGHHPQHTLKLTRFDLDCEDAQKSLIHSALESCIHRGRLSWKNLETSSQSSLKLFNDVLYPLSGSVQASQVKLEDLSLNIDQGRFNLAVKADLDIRLSLRANGRVSFVPGSSPQSGELTLRLDKVKAGFLNITGRVFSEIEKINHPQLRVARPYIYVTFP